MSDNSNNGNNGNKYDPFVWLTHLPFDGSNDVGYSVSRRLSEIAKLRKFNDVKDRTEVFFTDGTFIVTGECFDVIYAKLNRLIDQGRPVR